MRRLTIILALALALPFAAALTPPAAAQFSFLGLKNSLVDFVLDQISVPGEMELAAEGVEDTEDGATDIVGLTVADADGVWLSVERLSVRWNASRILRGELEIERLAASGVDVKRAPASSSVEVEVKEDSALAEDDGEPFDWPRSPITTRIDNLALERVTIAPGIIAEPGIAFDAEGAARDEGDEQAVSLTVVRTDEIAGRIVLDYLRTFEENRLNLKLDANEAAGGLVAALAGLPPESASTVNLNAEGPLTDWRLTLAAEVDEIVTAGGQAVVNATDRLAVDAEFEVTPGPALDEAVRAALAPSATLAIDIAEDEAGLVRVNAGALSSRDVSLTAAGTFDKAQSIADLTVDLEVRSGLAELIEGVSFDSFGFDGALTGPLDDLAAEGRFALSDLRTAPADVGAATLDGRVTVQGQTIGATLEGAASGLRIDRIQPELLGEAQLRIDGAWDGAVARLTELRIAALPITVSASGEANVEGNTAALSYTLDAPELGPFAAAYDVNASGALSASGDLSGPLDGPRLAGQAALERLTFEGEPYGDVRLTHDAVFDEAPDGTASIRASGSRFGPVAFDGGFELRDQRLALSDLVATALDARIEGALDIDLDATLIDGTVRLDAPDLRAIGGALGEPLAGAVAGDVRLAAVDGRQNVDVAVDASGIDGFGARLGQGRIDAAVTDALGEPAVEGEASLTDAAGFGVAAGGAVLKGSGGALTSDDPRFDATFAVDGIDAEAGRAGRVEGWARGRLSDLAAAVTAEDVEAEGARVARVEAEATVQAATSDDPRFDATFAADGVEAEGAAVGRVEGAAKGALSDLTARLSASRIDAGGARVARLNATAAVQGATSDDPRFDASFAVEEIDAGGATVRRAEGGAKGALSDLTARLDIRRINAGGVRAPRLTGEARVRDAASGDPRIDATIRAPELKAPTRVAIENATITANGTLSALAVAVDAKGKRRRKNLSVELRANADLAGAEQAVTVGTFAARLGKAEAALRAPLRVAIAGGTTRIEGLDLALPGGGLTGRAALHGNGAEGELALSVADLASLADVARTPIERGAINIDARFDTRPGPAGATVRIEGRDVRFEEVVADVGALDLDADLTWDGRLANATAALSGPFGDPFRVRASLPLRPSGGIAPAPPANGRIEGAVDWRGDIQRLWSLVPAPGHALAGETTIALTLGGTIDAPEVGGDISLTDGRYENLDAGTILVDVNVASRIEPGGAFALDLSANDGAGSPVTAKASLADGAVDARVTSNGAVLVRRDDATAAVTLDIAAAGPLEAIAVTGRIGVDRAEIRLVDATPPGVADIGPVRIKGVEPEEEEDGAAGAITLDLKVEAPSDVYVRGRGLDSEWMIDLTITGTAAQPLINGAITKRRGELSFLGRPLDLTRGAITFYGRPEPDPTIDILVARENEGVTGGIQVSGTASAPEISFTSTPVLPEDEVLPRILFGRSSSALSASEAVSLAIGLSTLLDGTGGLTDDIRGAVGLDVLRIEDGENGPSVTVGSNIIDGVFVGAKQPVDGGSASVEVEVEIFDDFTIDSETGPDTGTSIGLNWKKDF